MRVTARLLPLCALAALLTSACQLPRAPQQKLINSYLAEPADLANVRRIMVLPFMPAASVDADCDKIRDSFLAELQKLRRFEVVPLPSTAQENEVLNESLRHGRLSTEAMVRLCDRYALDGVLIGTVTSYRPYTPAHLGMRTHLVSIHSGATVWAVDAIYDANDRSTISDLQEYAAMMQYDDGTLHGWQLNLLAPTKFTNYVAHRFVGTWIEG
ncbi:MAG: hypothetical protein KDC98_23075 [Planctomycetes bacterium]|nr:hypothetical protein [Planctomycetota bacterium]